MKKNELVNKQQIEETSNNAQSRGNNNKENKNNEQQHTKISNGNKNKDRDYNSTVSKITDALNSVINRLNTLEKSIRLPTKVSVKERTTSDFTPTTTHQQVQ